MMMMIIIVVIIFSNDTVNQWGIRFLSQSLSLAIMMTLITFESHLKTTLIVAVYSLCYCYESTCSYKTDHTSQD